MHVAVLVGAVLALLGTFLPWIQLGTLIINRGIDNPDAAMIVVPAVIVGGVAAYNLWSRKMRLGWLQVAAAALIFWVGYMDLGEVQRRAQEAGSFLGATATVGAGIYVVLAGAVIIGLAGLATWIASRPFPSTGESPQAEKEGKPGS